MYKALRYFVSIVVALTLTLGSMAMTPAAQSGDAIHLKGGSFIPAQSQFAAGSQKYYIVQFSGPIEQSWKDAISAEGGEFLAYIPDFAFKVRMNPAQASQVSQQGSVSAVIPFQSQFKFGADLKRDGDVNLYQVRIETGSDFGLVRSLVARTGAEILGFESDIMVVAANASLLDAIAEVDDVASINNFQLNETFTAPNQPPQNDYASANIIGAAAANARGYDGSTQTVAVADTGLGEGTAATAHRDIPATRVVAVNNWRGVDDSCWSITDDGAIDVDSGHGTHTTGSVLSAGAPNGIGKGSAPAAKLVFQATENWATMKGICALYYPSGYYLTGLPSDLNSLFQQAYDQGARIHSNSWGSASAGDYTTNSVGADTFMWNHKDMVITFSAGNEGIDANSNGVIDNDSIGAPGTAKNVITVGASENQRSDGYPCDTSLTYTACASQNGQNNIFTWGAAWPADYPAEPIFSDVSANNAQQMAAFSSRGPTDDGRIKPDVVAPGSWILSTYSNMYQQGYDASPNPKNGAWQYDGYGFPYDSYYKYLSGTSMSNPLTAGGAAVVRDYYKEAYNLDASAALVKATLINSAVDLADENNDGVNDNDFPIPNSHEGWGLINLDAATDGSILYVNNSTGLSTGNSAVYQVTPTGGPLKITVVWTDYPSTDTATKNLVNDLDLSVTISGSTYRGNTFSGGWSQAGGTADRVNNVENVYIQSPAAGTYTVSVSAYNIPNGPQPFALVVDGGTLSAAPAPTSTGLVAPSANAAVTTNSGDNNGYQTNPANAYTDNASFAVDTDSGTGTSNLYTSTQKDRHTFSGFGFNIPTGATIQGIQVRLDAKTDNTNGSPTIYVELSWDGGVTWTAAQSTGSLAKNERTYTLGGTSNSWGHTWNAAEFSSTNFRVRVTDVATNTSRDFSLDYIAVNVTYLP